MRIHRCRRRATYSSSKLELYYCHDASVPAAAGKRYDHDGETPDAFENG